MVMKRFFLRVAIRRFQGTRAGVRDRTNKYELRDGNQRVGGEKDVSGGGRAPRARRAAGFGAASRRHDSACPRRRVARRAARCSRSEKCSSRTPLRTLPVPPRRETLRPVSVRTSSRNALVSASSRAAVLNADFFGAP